jgi:hypothetical protein
MVVFSKAKAVKAFAIGLVMSGLVVACNEAAPIAKTVAPEAEAVNTNIGNKSSFGTLTADERETVKRDFLAKPEVKELSSGLEEITQAIAVAVEDRDLRDRIYAKCMEKFDGETNVLWQQLESDNNLRAKGGWNKRIDDFVSKGRKNTVVKGVGNVDAAVKKFEKLVNAPLHLFWMYPSQWDKKTTPLIAFLPFDADPKTRQSIPAFDAKGNRYELDRKGALAKQRPVLVVTFNERSDVNGKPIESLVLGGCHEDKIKRVEIGQKVIKNQDRITSLIAPTQFCIVYAGILSTWSDPDGEWTGGQEYYYEYWYWGSYWASYVGDFYGPVYSQWNRPANSTLFPYHDLAGNPQECAIKYWEKDFWPFNDFIDEHYIPHPAQVYSDSYYDWPSKRYTSQVYAQYQFK